MNDPEFYARLAALAIAGFLCAIGLTVAILNLRQPRTAFSEMHPDRLAARRAERARRPENPNLNLPAASQMRLWAHINEASRGAPAKRRGL